MNLFFIPRQFLTIVSDVKEKKTSCFTFRLSAVRMHGIERTIMRYVKYMNGNTIYG